MKVINCPYCNQMTPTSNLKCTSCEISLDGIRIRCPYCYETNPIANEKCSSCEISLEGEYYSKAANGFKRCPYCDQINYTSDVKCSSCNKSLEGDEYLRAIVKKYKNAVEFHQSQRFRDLLTLEAEDLQQDPERRSDFFEIMEKLKNYDKKWLKEIRDALARESSLKVSDEGLRRELQEIRDKNLGEDPSWREFVYDEELEAAQDSLFNPYDPREIWEHAREIGTIIVGQSTPSIVSHYLDEIKLCYQYQLLNATIVFCRALLEVGLREFLRKQGVYKTNEKVIYLDECNLNGLIRECKEHNFLPRKSLNKLHAVRKKANRILHSSSKVTSCSQEETLSIVKDTFSVLEEIYR